MKRVEIIANQSVEQDIRDALAVRNVAQAHTAFHGVHGEGHSGPRRGDSTWPEENFVLVVYCEDPEANAICEAVAETKAQFPAEGIRVFTTG